MRQIIVLSVALVASLVGAYLTWTDESEEPTGDAVDVYAASDKDLQKVVWDGEKVDVTVERRRDESGDYLWIESTETKLPRKPPKPPKPPEGEDVPPVDGQDPAAEPEPEAEPEPVPEIVTTKFVGNAQAEEMWTAFAPLRSPRRLDAAATDVSTFGFGDAPAAPEPEPEPEGDGDGHPHEGEEGDDPHAPPTPKKAPEKASIQVVRGSGPITLTLGGETYGAKHRYVQHEGAVYLVEQETLRSLQSAASRLVERSLFPFEEADIEQVDVALPDGTTFAFVQQNRDDRAKAYWARPEALEQQDDTVGTWLGKVFKLRLREYVEAAEVTAPLEPVLTYTVKGKGASWPVEIVRATTTGDDGQPKTEWYAKSTYNRSLVTLTESLVNNVVDDLDALSAPSTPAVPAPAPEE